VECTLLFVKAVKLKDSVRKEQQQQPSQCSHPQRIPTVPQPATSNTTSKYTPYAITVVFSPEDGHKDARNMLRQCQ